jgi:hypothetical protein
MSGRLFAGVPETASAFTGSVTVKETTGRRSEWRIDRFTRSASQLCPALEYQFRADDHDAVLISWTPQVPTGRALSRFFSFCGVRNPATVIRKVDPSAVGVSVDRVLRDAGHTASAQRAARWLPDGFAALSQLVFDAGGTIRDTLTIHGLLLVQGVSPARYVQHVRSHAYDLADADGVDVPFEILDRMAESTSAERRTRGAIISALARGERRGDTASTWGYVVGAASAMLDEPTTDNVYRAVQTECERPTGARIESIRSEGTHFLSRKIVAVRETRTAIGIVAQANRPLRRRLPAIDLDDPEQTEIINAVSRRPLTVVCGAAGTGKTYTVRLALQAAERAGWSVAWTATTGRASKVLSPTGTTLHAFLQVGPTDSLHRRIDPVDILVVDEASMLDAALAAPLATYLSAGLAGRVVLIGDPYQLPPVGAGKVLADLRDHPPAGVAVVELRTVRRTKSTGILALGSAIRARTAIPDTTFMHDVNVLPLTDDSAVDLARIVEVSAGADTLVVAPRKDGRLGVIALNRALRDAHLRPDDADWLPGEKIVQSRTTTSPEGELIVNGTFGTVVAVDDSTITVVYEDDAGTVIWPRRLCPPDDRAIIIPAYALTVHKAQGSQRARVVVISSPPPQNEGPGPWDDPATGYTAVTRAVNELTIFGNPTALFGNRARTVNARRTMLPERMVRAAGRNRQVT